MIRLICLLTFAISTEAIDTEALLEQPNAEIEPDVYYLISTQHGPGYGKLLTYRSSAWKLFLPGALKGAAVGAVPGAGAALFCGIGLKGTILYGVPAYAAGLIVGGALTYGCALGAVLLLIPIYLYQRSALVLSHNRPIQWRLEAVEGSNPNGFRLLSAISTERRCKGNKYIAASKFNKRVTLASATETVMVAKEASFNQGYYLQILNGEKAKWLNASGRKRVSLRSNSATPWKLERIPVRYQYDRNI